MRRVIAALIVVGLTIAVILLWPSPTAEIPPDTIAGATTTTTTTSPTTTTVPDTTTTSAVEGSHVVETVEEAEEILRELWFGWFEGIYHQDEDRIREVVATQAFLDAGVNAFGNLPFTAEPSREGLDFEELEILLTSAECLAVWSVSTTSFLDTDEARSGVEVLRLFDGEWRFASAWRFRNDLWEGDCEAELSSLS
jgi:hypothetical protein